MERPGVREVAALLLLLLAGCANQPAAAEPERTVTAPAPPPAPIRTDRSAYTMQDGRLTIVATFTAPRDTAAYITHCNGAQPMGLQRLVGHDWIDAWVATLNACFSEPIEVRPGRTHTATLGLAPGAGAVTYPRGRESIESGTYRVAWYGVLRSYDPKKPPFGDPLPQELRVSAPFTIEVPPAVASTPPPPPHVRSVATARVSGQVLGARGQRVMHAEVLVRSADAACRPIPTMFVGAVSDENGEYFALAQLGSPQPMRGCVLVDARSGGASASASQRVEFTTDGPPVRVDVRLPRPPALTQSEAERVVRLLTKAINDPHQTSAELGLYILHGPEALRVALQQYQTHLGRVTDVRPASGSGYAFELVGENGRTSRVELIQEELTRLHSPLIDYGFRAERFMTTYLRAISSGDAELLSRVLNPDDVDFPVERARQMIADYRRRYRDPAYIRAEFAGVDERRNALLWRLRGPGPAGEEVTEPIELGFGDGLIGVRGL